MSPKSLVLLLFIPCVISVNPLLTEKPVVDGFGINIHWTHPRTGELEMISEAGFKWARVDFFWTLTEKSKGVYNFSDYEYLLQQLDKLNMSALCILAYDNPIYDTVSTESGRTAYVKWAATAILHLKGRGVIWEIWNEPNSNPFWKGQPPNATLYSKMALETIKAVREKTPDEIVIGPATSGVDLHFLEQCFRSCEHNISIPSDKCDFEIIHHKGSPVQKASSNGGTVVLMANVFVRFIVVKCSNNIALQTAPDFY